MGQPFSLDAPQPGVLNTQHHSNTAAASGIDDGWEYEYDEVETEDLYFTLDLTTHVPSAVVDKKAQTGKTTPDPDDAEAATLLTAAGGSPVEKRPVESAGSLQIIDLHTRAPLVKLDDDVFTCQWTTDLGTQFHIAEAGVVNSPRRPGTILDIIGTSQTRLIARPIQLKSRNEVQKSTPPKRGRPANSICIDPEDNPGLQTGPGQQLKIPREMCRNEVAKSQATFLERLSEIKLKRGEKDVVPIQSVRMYDPPENIEELRQKGLAVDAEEIKKAKNNALSHSGQRAVKRRRKLTFAERGFPPEDAPRPGSGRHTREAITTSLGLNLPDESLVGMSLTGQQHVTDNGTPGASNAPQAVDGEEMRQSTTEGEPGEQTSKDVPD